MNALPINNGLRASAAASHVRTGPPPEAPPKSRPAGETLSVVIVAAGASLNIAAEPSSLRTHLVLHVLPAEVRPGGPLPDVSHCVLLSDRSRAMVLQNDGTTEARIVSIELAAERLGHLVLSGISGVVELDPMLPSTAALGAYVATSVNALSRLSAEARGNEFEAFMNAIVELVRLVLERRRRTRLSGLSSAELPRVEAICVFIDRHLLSSELSPELIAGEFAMSRATLYRLFEPLGGVGRYIRQQRLVWAAARVVQEGASRRTLAALARRLGFSSTRGFLKAYQSTFGRLPGG